MISTQALNEAFASYSKNCRDFNDNLTACCVALNRLFNTVDEKQTETNPAVPGVTFENILNGVDSL